SVVALTLSLALYVAAVYLYDEISMPEGYWNPGPQIKSAKSYDSKFGNRVRRFGPVYAYMVRAWVFVFTPAVFCSAVGFLALFWRAEIEVPTLAVAATCLV